MSSTTSDILAPSNAANQPSTAQLVAQVEALTRIVESSVVQSKTATVTNRKKRSAPDENDPESAQKATLRSDDEEHKETEVEKRLTESWNPLKDTIPGFSEDMIGLAGKRQLRKHVCSELQGGLRGARGDDTNSLKAPIGDYVKPLPVLSDSGEPLPVSVLKFSASGTKADRGHPATEETYTRIRNGEIVVLGTEMPYLMYRDGHVYNPDDMEDGLLEGSTLFAVAKHIYQGPSTALKHDGFTRGKAGNAALNGITALTGHDVAYVAVQARFGLLSQDQWGHMDGNFSYRDFYWSIVDLLKGEEGQEIIDRFNMKVFGTKSSSKKSAPVVAAGPSDFEVLEAQRAAKRARKIAAAAASSAAV
ncbi:hypothetical protein MVEN_00321800 [Mycena venus]|uniref:Uncharacterized protein n=1 Tax=Mycena venus TaxID=2733690 RepID=A0A8H7DA57_9AGAR|nr:hypothetical protein MVEN_00321800 [Mycena venus]